MFIMSTLENIYCLGCKTRHSSVEVDVVNTLYVKGSPRYQAKGICSEGKKWTKLLNKAERENLKDFLTTDNEEQNLDSEPLQGQEVRPELELQNGVEETQEVVETIIEEYSPADEVIESVVEVIESVVEVIEPVQHYPAVDESQVLDTVMMIKEPIEVVIEKSPIEHEVINLHREVRELRTPPRPRTVQNKQSDIQAIRVGRHLGYSSAVRAGPQYRRYLRQHFDKTKLHMRYFDSFASEYVEAGDNYLRSIQEEYVEVKDSAVDDGLSTPAVAGLAAVSIFGAWMAAKFNKR